MALALAAGACSGGATPDTTTTTAAGTPTTVPVDDGPPPLDTGEPFGLEATVSLDETAAQRRLVIAAEGGIVEGVGADGTAYRLIIPPGALLADAVITMTPLAALEGEFVDGLIGGVDLRPAGLQFHEAATLEITPARDVPIERQVPFAYEGDASRIALGLIQPDPDRLVLWVLHFSGTGVLESTDMRMEVNRRLAAHEARAGDAAAQRVNEIVIAARENGARDASGFAPEVSAIMRDYYQNHLSPRMEYAERLAESRNPGDLEYIAGVVAGVAELLRNAELFGSGLAEELDAEFWAWLDRIVAKAYRAMYDRCVQDHDFTVVPILADMARSMQLLGATTGLDGILECLRFEVRYESEVVVSGAEGQMTFPTETRIVVNLAHLEGPETFEAPLSYADAEWSDPGTGEGGCSSEVVEISDGTFGIGSVRLEWKPENMDGGLPKRRADGRLVPPGDVMLLYDIGAAMLRQRIIDGDRCTWSGAPIIETDILRQAWRALHAADEVAPYWLATEWEMLFDGELVARKVYERQLSFELCYFDGLLCDDARAVERTTLELIHAPGG